MHCLQGLEFKLKDWPMIISSLLGQISWYISFRKKRIYILLFQCHSNLCLVFFLYALSQHWRRQHCVYFYTQDCLAMETSLVLYLQNSF